MIPFIAVNKSRNFAKILTKTHYELLLPLLEISDPAAKTMDQAKVR